MEEAVISTKEMVNFIQSKLLDLNISISNDLIDTILELQEDFLESKGLISIEYDSEY